MSEPSAGRKAGEGREPKTERAQDSFRIALKM
jgi:hypothetical protein